MKKNLIIIGSITYAHKAKDYLNSKGISAYIERNKKTREYGCGYALYLPRDFEKAVDLLKSKGYKISAVLKDFESSR